ncbi:MAG: hypothetical protein GXP54_13090 [Deltaproteobacteria bacterium]|nr:hypothetical protein [Deltaproteobacteria bacterium]
MRSRRWICIEGSVLAMALVFGACGSDGGKDAGDVTVADIADAVDVGGDAADTTTAPDDVSVDPGLADPGLADSGSTDPGFTDPGSDPGGDTTDIGLKDTGWEIEPPPCCKDDDECFEWQVCVAKGLGAGGMCFAAPKVDECYYNTDCPDKYFCWGQQICACDMNCMSEPGTCLALPGDCCSNDNDCDAGMKCVPSWGGETGVCEVFAKEGKCWTDNDCGPSQACEGAFVCGCDADCDQPDMPGECVGVSDCCKTDEDCGGGVCAGTGAEATCEPIPEFGKCWDDSDCYETQKCTGASFCPCGALCFAADTIGTCTPLPSGCCNNDDDCGEGLVCRGVIESDHMPGSCVPDPNGSQCPGDYMCCWDDGDCVGGSKCSGANVCSCIALCINCGACAPNQMGKCP